MIMRQEEFVKKFCPNTIKKLKEEIPDFDSRRGNEAFWLFMDFCNKYFGEALENFAKRICNKQRKVCANDAKCKFNNDVFSSRSTSIYSIMDAILNAEQPKIEDL